MSRPLALDLFCCAGGSTTGLERAGFDVIGVDWKPSQHWCGAGELHQADLSTADAVESVIRAFAPDFVSASPPCQRFSAATPTKNREAHPDLIDSTRQGIIAAGVPGWIENVRGAPLHHAIRLCGVMFPETQKLKRHRFFELIGWFTLEPEHQNCMFRPDGERRPVICTVPGATSVRGSGNGQDKAKRRAWRERVRRDVVTVCGQNGANRGGKPNSWQQNHPGPECINWREALGWIDGPRHRYSLAQAIPPAYAEWLGRRFLESRR